MDEKQPIIIQGTSIQRERIRQKVSSPRKTRPTRRIRTVKNNVDDVVQTAALIRKVGISVMAILLVLLLKTIDIPFTQTIVGHVRSTITNDFRLDEALGQLKFVQDYLPDITAVFGQRSTTPVPDVDKEESIVFSAPVQGEVIRMFGHTADAGIELNNFGIDILTKAEAIIYASAKGRVAALEEHEIYGTSLWIDHGDNVFSFYGGCDRLDVVVGESVDRGDRLGVVGVLDTKQSILHFEIWMDDQAVDPITVLEEGSKVIWQEGLGDANWQNI